MTSLKRLSDYIQQLDAIYSHEELIQRAKTVANVVQAILPFVIILIIANVAVTFRPEIGFILFLSSIASFGVFALIIYFGQRGKLSLLIWLPILLGLFPIYIASYLNGEPYFYLIFFIFLPMWGMSISNVRSALLLSLLAPLNIIIFYIFVPNTLTGSNFIQWLSVAVFIEIIFIVNMVYALQREMTYRNQLLQQQKISIRKEAMMDYLSSVNHDFRSPLSAILLSTTLLKRQQTDPVKYEAHLERITFSVQRIEDIVTQSNTWIELSNQQTAEYTDFNLKDMLEALRTAQHSVIEARKIEITVDETFTEMITTDPHLLYTALSELVDNAILATTIDDTILIKAQHHQKQVVITVEDTGIGIPEENLPYLFEPFYQSNDAFSNTKGRNGLGLAIVQRCVELLAGDITIASQHNHGTTVTMTFPQLADKPIA